MSMRLRSHRRGTIGLLLVVGTFLLSPTPPAAAREPAAAQEPDAGLHAFLDGFIRAFDDLDWPAFAGMFDDDATVFYPSPPNAPIRATGRREFESAWQRVFQGIRGTRTTPPFMNLQPERLQIQRFTDLAIVTFELHDLPGITGRRTLVLQRRAGVWHIVHLHASNAPTPPAP